MAKYKLMQVTLVTISPFQYPLLSLAGSDCVSLTAFLPLLPPVQQYSTVSPGGGPSTHHPIKGSKVPQMCQVVPENSCSPYCFACRKAQRQCPNADHEDNL